MSGAACKAVICGDKAQGQLQGMIETIDGIQGAGNEVVTTASEIVIKHMEACTKDLVTYFNTLPE